MSARTETLPTPTRTAILAALVVFAAGFGVMALLSASGAWTVGRSMWHYRAATWGDILIVPGIAAVLAAGLCDSRIPPHQPERAWAAVGALAFGLTGALVQVSWLASSAPILNWTLPRPHHFSFPGWYHAVYLVIVAAAIGGAGAILACRVRLAPAEVRDYVANLPATAVLLGFGVSFGLALYLDSIDSLNTSAGAGSALGALAAALATIALLFFVVGPRRSLRPLLRGSLVVLFVFAGMLITYGLPN
jgi:hypothetical protein